MKAKTENIDIKNNLKNKVEKITEARVLVIGDLMLDKFTYGDVIRISPDYGVKKEDLPAIAQNSKFTSGLYETDPHDFSDEDILRILEKSYK